MNQSPSTRILAPEQAEEWRRDRRNVVFTNGVFDILHPGHIRLLEGARAMGDSLIVALNDDSSARSLGKGEDRPVNRLLARQRVVAALRCVDCVTSFCEATPEDLIGRLRPDVLVKGADYRIEEIPGRDFVERTGGRVVTIELEKGFSTTETLRRIRGEE